MNKLTSIRIKQNDGTYSDDIPVQVLAENVSWILGSSISLLDILGDVKYTTKGSIQHQLDTFSLDEVENARVGADDTQYQNLKARLDSEYEDLQNAIAAVATNLQTETGARSNADTAIRTDLNSETTARINGDNLLSSQIATEVNARKAAINSQVTARNNAISSAVATEVTNRNNAINSAIATEVTDRNNAISSAIATEVNNRNEAITTEVNNRNEAISTEASIRATTDASLQSQINQLIAPSGEAPSAAEIENARIGADGVTYNTLGDAIRTQITNVSNDMNHIVSVVPMVKQDAGFSLINGFPIVSGHKYKVYIKALSASGVSSGRLALTGSSQVSVTGAQIDGGVTLTLTAGATRDCARLYAVWGSEPNNGVFVFVSVTDSTNPTSLQNSRQSTFFDRYHEYAICGDASIVETTGGQTVIADFPAYANHSFAVFVKSDVLLSGTYAVGLGSMGNYVLDASELNKGAFLFFEPGGTAIEHSRFYIDAKNSDVRLAEIHYELIDLIDPVGFYELMKRENMPSVIDVELENLGWISSSDGKIGQSTYNLISDYVPVRPGDKVSYCLRGYNNANGLLIFYNHNKTSFTPVAVGTSAADYVIGTYTVPSRGYIRAATRIENQNDPLAYCVINKEPVLPTQYCMKVKDGAATFSINPPDIDHSYVVRMLDSEYGLVRQVYLYNYKFAYAVPENTEFVQLMLSNDPISPDRFVTEGLVRDREIMDADILYKHGLSLRDTDDKYVTTNDSAVMVTDYYFELTGDALVKTRTNENDSCFVRFFDKNFERLGNLGQSMSTTLNVSAETISNAGAKYVKFGTVNNAVPVNPYMFDSGINTDKIFHRVITKSYDDILYSENLKYVAAQSKFLPSDGYESDYSSRKHKYFTIGMISDIHGDIDRFDRFVNLVSANDNDRYRVFDLALHGGDLIHNNQDENAYTRYNVVAMGGQDWLADHIKNIGIPFINCVGNHDCGWTNWISAFDNETIYEKYVSPTAIKNDNKTPWGYIDFDEYKIRVIVVFDFDSQIVEKATAAGLDQLPAIHGFATIYSQEQIDWLAATLSSTPDNYSVIICGHVPQLYKTGTVQNLEPFTAKNYYTSQSGVESEAYHAYGFRNSDGGGMGLIPDIVKAWSRRESINETYSYVGNSQWPADLTYMTDVRANYNFTNSKGKFGFYLCGHMHINLAVKATVSGYENQTMIVVDTGSCENYQIGSNEWNAARRLNTVSQDAVFGIVFNTDNQTVGIVRIGADTDYDGEERPLSVISL